MSVRPHAPQPGDAVYMDTLDVIGKAIGFVGPDYLTANAIGGDYQPSGNFAIDIGPGPWLCVDPAELHEGRDGWEWSP